MARSLFSILRSRYGPRITDEDRRGFLRASLAASAGLLLSGPAYALARAAAGGSAKGKRIVVVGAGFSGLACAHELNSLGYDVTVLDARDRLGGRVYSLNAALGSEFIKGRNIEAGAELIGSNHLAWVNYADKFGLKFLPVTEDEGEVESPAVIDGKVLEGEGGAKLWEELEATLNQMNKDAEPINADEPWLSPDATKLDAMSTQQWIDKLEVSDLCKRAVWVNQTADNGQPASKQSYLGQLAAVKGGGLEKYWKESEVYRCEGGNQQLALKLAEPFKSKIVLGLGVVSITRTDSGVVVECRDGRKIECDDVVLSAPPATWKKIQISPPLPEAMKPQVGVNTKYLAHVRDRFWETGEPKRSQYAISDSFINLTWDATDAQGPVEGTGGACLTGFGGGERCEQAMNMSKADREKAFHDLYEQWYPGFKDHFVAARFMDWPKDPLAGASYSFPAPGQVTTVGPLMAKAHLGDRLHLAGEHTCYKFVGYMEGGLDSGIRIAKRLAKRDGLIKD